MSASATLVLQDHSRLIFSALGDSLTYGYLVQEGYLDMVEAGLRRSLPNTDVRVLNHGVCGDTIFDGIGRAGEAFFSTCPDVGLIQFGLNDCFSGISPSEFSQGLEELLGTCRTRVPAMKVVLIPPPPVRDPGFDRAAQPFRDAKVAAAGRHGAVAARVAELWGALHAADLPRATNHEPRATSHEPPATASPPETLWLSDGVHPSMAGYRRMAWAVLEALGVPPAADVKVRAHHLLCLLAFAGEGYSDTFEQEFGRLARTYRTSGKLMEIVCGSDEACAACPHLGAEGCRSAEDGPEPRVLELDNAVLDALGLRPGLFESSFLLARVRALSPALLHSLCSKCSWYGKLPCQERILSGA